MKLSKALGGNFPAIKGPKAYKGNFLNTFRKYNLCAFLFAGFLTKMLLTIENIINLSEKKIAHLHALDKKTGKKLRKKYITSIKKQIERAEKDIKKGNSSDIETHLGNLFWSYLCLVSSLEEDKISYKEEIFHKMFSKYHRKLNKNLSRDELIEKKSGTKKKKLSLYLGNLMGGKKKK